jgi:hypothetical protein
MTQLGGLVCAGALICVLAGCLSVRGTVSDSMDEVSKQQNWEKLKKPARALAAEIFGGTADALSPPGGGSALDDYVTRFMKITATELDADLGPAVARQVRGAVAAVIDEIMSDKARAGTEQLVEAITRTAVSSLGSGAAAELRTHLGPQLGDLIEHVVGPALARSLTNDLGPALAAILRDGIMRTLATSLQTDLQPKLVGLVEASSAAAGRGFFTGALDKIEPAVDRMMARLDATAQAGKQGAQSVFYTVVALVLALIIGILGAIVIARQRQLSNTQSALRMVASEIRDMDTNPHVRELAARIKQHSVKHKPGGAALTAFLESNPELKVRKLRPPALGPDEDLPG